MRACPVPHLPHLRWSAGGNAVKTSGKTIRPSTLNFAICVNIEGVVTIVSHVPTKANPPTPNHIRIEDKASCTLSDMTRMHTYISHHISPNYRLTYPSMKPNQAVNDKSLSLHRHTQDRPTLNLFKVLLRHKRPTDTYFYPVTTTRCTKKDGSFKIWWDLMLIVLHC